MPLLTSTQKRRFARDGFILLRGFYDLRRDIQPIQRAVHVIIGLVIRRHGLRIRQRPFASNRFDSGYQELIAANRAAGGEVYDAVKQIPAYIRLVADPRHDRLLSELRRGSVPRAGYRSGSHSRPRNATALPGTRNTRHSCAVWTDWFCGARSLRSRRNWGR